MMHITAKSRYALKIMLELALFPNELLKRSAIAKKHQIPLDFMDQITSRLRKKELISTVRGPLGGLRLSIPPQKINLWDIFSAVEDQVYPVKCLHAHTCEHENDCIAFDAWHEIFFSIQTELRKKNLAKLASSAYERSKK